MFNLRGRGRLYCSAVSLVFVISLFTYIIVFNPITWEWPTATSTDNVSSDFHYGVIIDAGSSGSRVFVYQWPTHSGNPKELLHIETMLDHKGRPVVKKVSPGLSSLRDTPHKAGVYIAPLLDLAAENVPSSKHQETPLYILATAGMRMIPEDSKNSIIDELRVSIRLRYRFLFQDSHVEVISGKQEGVYGWIATNYLLGRFNHNHNDSVELVSVPKDHYMGSDLQQQQHHRKRTVGVLDMGGGSMQIAYEVDKNAKLNSKLAAEFNLGCKETDVEHTYRIYVTTFLGYGANAARRRMEQLLWNELNQTVDITDNNNLTQSTPVITDPCLPPGLSVTSHVEAPLPPSPSTDDDPVQTTDKKKKKRRTVTVEVTFQGGGNFQECLRKSNRLLGREAPCPRTPCSMRGVHQPPIDFETMEFYGFSEFWYCSEDVFGLGGHYDFTKYYTASKKFCSTDWLRLTARYQSGVYKKANLNRMKLQCFKSAWISTVLHNGYRFPRSYDHFTSVNEIDQTEVQWSLGAMLYLTRYFPLREVQRKQFLDMRRSRVHRLDSTYKYWILGSAVILVFLLIGQSHGLLVRQPPLFYKVMHGASGGCCRREGSGSGSPPQHHHPTSVEPPSSQHPLVSSTNIRMGEF